MIVSITDRLKPRPVIIFAVVVFIVQRLEHTNLTFATLTAAFTIISAVAYNIAGGLSYPAGAYILFNATLTSILGITYKLFLGEPGESNLHAPNTTMLAYCLAMVGMALAAALNHRLRPKRPLLPNLDVETMRYAAVGCLVVGAIVQVNTNFSIEQGGTLSSALHQLNYLPRMALIFAVIYELAKSNGKRSTNWIVWASGLFMFFYGLIGFTKEGMFVSVVTWALTCVLYRYKFTWRQLVLGGAFVAFAQFILLPFSQYGRRSRSDVTSETIGIATAYQYLKNPLETRELYLNDAADAQFENAPHLYDTQQGFMDRMNMVSVDDAIIDYTDQGNIFGLTPVWQSFANVVPRVFWKDKPPLAVGNEFAHEIHMVAEDDTSTGISFGPAGDAYHEATWFGVVIVFPIIIFLYFFVTESLTGSVRDTPYALLPIALAAHAAPEGMMEAPIYLATYGVALLVVVAFLSKYVLARFTRVAMGGDRTRVELTQNVFATTARLPRPAVPPVEPSAQTP